MAYLVSHKYQQHKSYLEILHQYQQDQHYKLYCILALAGVVLGVLVVISHPRINISSISISRIALAALVALAVVVFNYQHLEILHQPQQHNKHCCIGGQLASFYKQQHQEQQYQQHYKHRISTAASRSRDAASMPYKQQQQQQHQWHIEILYQQHQHYKHCRISSSSISSTRRSSIISNAASAPYKQHQQQQHYKDCCIGA